MKNVQTVVYLIYYVPAVLRRSEDLHFSGKIGELTYSRIVYF